MSQSVKNNSGSSGSAQKRPSDGEHAPGKLRRLGPPGPPPPPRISGGGDRPSPPAPRISISLGAKKPPPLPSQPPPLPFEPPPPPPAKKPLVKGITMKLGGNKPLAGAAPAVALKPKSSLAARAFGADSDSDDDEMPAEAKMRMKNIGRDTPTSAGPNSFGKTKIGFCDTKRKRDKDIEDAGKED